MVQAQLSSLFTKQLSNFGISLEDDAVDYITSMLLESSLDDPDELREATEPFLIDASMEQSQLDAFYKALSREMGPSETGNAASTPAQRLPVAKQPSSTSPVAKPVQNSDSETPSLDKADDKLASPSKDLARKRNKRRGKNKNAGAEEDEVEEANIVATSQQSRFHLETLETNSMDIDLPTVNITVNNLDLLVDAHLKLKPGVRYGLVGQNGVGKSVLLKCLGENILIGLPQNLHILHISQLEDFDANTTVKEEVLASDKATTAALEEANALTSVMGSTKAAEVSGVKVSEAVFDIVVKRLAQRVDDASRLATKRSGARGREARQQLVQLEEEFAQLKKQDPHTYVTPQMTNDIISQVFERAELVNMEARRAKASKVLKGLGFSDREMEAPVSTFSGGWRMRIALAKALFLEPNILLLDEPTNHLDLSAILWLQEYLINETDDLTVVVVSHDREFLNAVTEETIIFKDKQLKYHAGNFEDYERNSEEQRIRKQTMLDAQEKRKKQILASIQHNAQQAKATGDDKRHGMIASRKKKLERLGMEKTEDGKRFKLNNRAGYFLSTHEQIVVEKASKSASIKIPDPTPLRYHGPVFSMKSVSFRYPKATSDIIHNFSINIGMTSRITFLGTNGSGKTTLLNLLTGKLQPTSGEVYRHPLLRIGYFSQNVVDQLDMDRTPVEEMMRQYPSLSEQDCRAHFGTVGISGNVVLRKIKSLSGGQRSRVAFAMTLYELPHVLILDEITNHLDMGTIDNFVEALAGFQGALILVSHDVWFLKQLMETLPEEEEDEEVAVQDDIVYYEVKGGRVKRWEDDIDAYVGSVLKHVRKTRF
ncbi:P-loop containing nucleoside triphosphate hydrolase protein [Radiomyces spectabilis]|uniref:P-loop containing nucleoside triphosphate hydrolase protein n=1 Tax=Radiomyces spectabilis TaxID=64574 RepID=UPI00221FA176|nr:P-loop containing nucleoside triphosphate hydrolase protein [Radiomyces spectabilis]KAI8370531.1 P-loop containing nucleoside triphosphate hydrolase protein [Radiomyces spectabilis]